MIAAGSLFTSCIEPVEPAGIYDLREAKARYYDALSKLRAADAELVLAQADLEKAKAELKRAKVEEQQLLNEMQRLKNELKAAQNEKDKADLAAQIEELKKQHEINMQNLETNLITAKWNFEQARRNIDAAAADLTQAEKDKLAAVMTAYETAYGNYIDALEDLRDAESDLWDLENGTQYFFAGDYVNAGEYYQSRQEYYEDEADYYLALYQSLTESTMKDWYDSLSTWQLYVAALKYEKQQITKDSLDYFVNVYHEGAFNFNLGVAKWVEENEPFADPGDGPEAPEEPKADATSYENMYEYTGDDPDIVHHKGDIVSGAPQIEFEKLENTNLSTVVYNKFVYLLDSYRQDSPAKTGTDIMNDAAGDGYVELTADQDMKDFILGAKDAQKLSYKRTKESAPIYAYYGLWGAYYTLEREMVLESEKDPKTIDDYKKDWEDAEKQWKNDREILDNGLANYKTYTDALATYNTKKQAYDDAVEDASEDSGDLAKAAEAVVARINKAVWHNEKLSYYDSSELVKTFVDFAKARKEYLAYTAYKNSNKDSNNFYYAFATSPQIRDSIAFDEITYEQLVPGVDGCRYNFEDTTYTKNPGAAAGYAAFQRIAWQLLGQKAGDIFSTMSASNEQQITVDDINTVAFYNAYQYKDKKIKTLVPEEEYVPKSVTDAKKALDNAETGVKNAAKAFVQIYNRFWAQTANTTITSDPYTKFDTYFASEKADDLTKAQDAFKIGGTLLPLNHKCYTYDTFTKPYNVVSFSDENTLVETQVLCAILTAVDPAADGHRKDNTYFEGNLTSAQIFYGPAPAPNNKTDFFKMMYALYLYEKKAAKSEDLKIIKAWIESVEKAFADDETTTEEAIKAAYAIDKAEYDKKVATYDVDKKAYDEYIAALKAFVGEDEDGNPTPNLVAWAWKDGDLVQIPAAYQDEMDPDVMAVEFYNDYVQLKFKDAYTLVGEWAYDYSGYLDYEPLVAGIKELAEECVPGFPEKLAELATMSITLDDQIYHYETLVEKMGEAFLAAAQAINDYNTLEGTSFDDYAIYSNIDSPEAIDYDDFKEYVDAFISWINMQYTLSADEAVMYEHAYEKYVAGLDQEQIDIELQKERVAMYTKILEMRETELAIAKAAYEKVLAAILGNM